MSKTVIILFALFMLVGLPCGECQAQDTKNMLVANVREFGAKGDGKSDDTEAIDKAWAFVIDTGKPQFHGAAHGKQRSYVTANTTLYFPPGVYRYTGKGLVSTAASSSQSWHVKGDGFSSARIEIESDVYLITSGRVESTIVEGISFSGGKGVFKSEWTKNMVGGKHIFRDCTFINYTECAIGNNADDSPYLAVSDCIFQCLKGAEAIGIAWGGYVDDSQITRCAFEQNAYHIKIGDRLSGNFQIGPRNSFISFGGTKTLADVWIVPNSEGRYGVNSGQGTIIAENKFGNENLDPSKPRILIATEDKDSGADRLSRKPNMTADDDHTQWVLGVKIRDNLFCGCFEMQHGIVYSCISNARLVFDHNGYAGSPYPYLIEFAPGIKRLADREATFVYEQERNNDVFEAQRISNLPGYAIPFDPSLCFAGRPEVPSAWQRDDDPGYQPVVSLTGIKMHPEGTAKTSATQDAHGGMSAALVEFGKKQDALALRIDEGKMLKEGKVGFIEVELKKAPDKPLDLVQVRLAHNNRQEDVCARTVELQDDWQRITIPFVIRNLDKGTFHLVLMPNNYYGKTDQGSFICGNVRLYHAAAPHSGVRQGVKTVGDADTAIILGRDPSVIAIAGSLTADRTISFKSPAPTVQPLPGFQYKIVRSAEGSAKVRIADITTLDKNEWCELVYEGSAYRLLAKGSLR